MDNILGTGFITITDLSDPIISSTEPPSAVEDMLWLDISTTPPVLKVYKNGQWIAVSETGSLPDSVPVGGYFGGDFLVNQSITGVKKAGEIKINAGAYIHPDGTTYVIPNNKAIYTGCKGKEGDIRYILFIGSDASRFTFSSDSASRHFVETVYKNKSWYYFVNDKAEREFEISQKDCIVAKIEEHTSLDASNGIKNIIKYYEDKETIFEALTDGGKNQAIYKKNGLLYINAEFIKAGKIASLNGLSEFDLENGALKVGAKTGNHLIFDGNELSIKASKINIGASTVATNTDVGNAVNAGINNLQIGGRNLATETNRGVTGWDWALATGGKTITEVSEDGIRCCKFVRDSVSSTGWNYIMYNKINRNKYLPNKQYTVSFEVKASVVTSFYVTLMEGNSTNALCTAVKTSNTIANTWTKLSVTLTTVSTLPTSTSQVLYMQGMNSGVGVSYIFRNLVISEGNKPTAWTPAPEDIDSNIQGVKDNLKNNYSTTTQMKSAIEQSASGILSTVSSTYTTKNDFNNLQIGGRNLIKNSNFITQATSSSNASIYSVSLVDGISLNEMFLHKTVTFSYFVNCTGNRQNGSGDLGNRFGIHGTVTWKNSSTGKTTINYPFAECLTGTYENKRVVMHYTFTPPSGYDVIASFNFAFQPLAKPGANNTVVWKIGQPKLEIGNKATDYSPAPEDIDSNMQGIKDNLKNNYSTTLQMNSAIEQKASGILSTVSSTYTTKNDFNNLQIGGRNLLIKNSLESGNLSGANGSVLEGTYANFYRTKNFIDVDNSSKYILTINKYTSSDVIEKIVAYNSSGAYISTHSINAKQAIFTPPANCTKIKFVVIIANANTLTIVESFKIKLEKGTKATDWTPAPEDIDSSMQGIKDDLKNNYSTTLQMNSAIEQKASGILSTVSSTYTTKTDFNNLQIGGRNYCRDTITSWTITGNNTPNQTGYKYSISKPSDLAGQKINVSFKYTVSNYGGGCFRLQTNAPSYLGGSSSITPSGNGVFTSNFTATYGSSFSSTTMGIRLDNFIGTIVISELKLEIGNKSTSWTPAPEDVDSNIQGVKDDLKNNYSTTTQMKSAVEQSASGVLSTVSKSYYTKSETDKQITSKGYQTASQVQQTVDGLESKVSESGGYNLLRNSTFKNNDIEEWWYWGGAKTYWNKNYFTQTGDMWFGIMDDSVGGLWQNHHELEPNTTYTFSVAIGWEFNVKEAKFVIEYTPDYENNEAQIDSQHFGFQNDSSIRQSFTFTTPANIRYAKMGFWHGGSHADAGYLIHINKPCLTKGIGKVWTPNPIEALDKATSAKQTAEGFNQTITKTLAENYYKKTEIDSTIDGVKYQFTQSGGYNLLLNSQPNRDTTAGWNIREYNLQGPNLHRTFGIKNDEWTGYEPALELRIQDMTSGEYRMTQDIDTTVGQSYIFTGYIAGHRCNKSIYIRSEAANEWDITKWTTYHSTIHGAGNGDDYSQWVQINIPFVAHRSKTSIEIMITNTDGSTDGCLWVKKLMVTPGTTVKPWSANPNEIYDGITTIDKDGIKVSMQDGEGSQGYTRIAHDGMEIFNSHGTRIAHFGDNESAYIKSLTAEQINNPLLLRWNRDRPHNLYVAPHATGDGTGRDPNNRASSITNTLNWLWKTHGCYSWQCDINIYLAGGDYWGADHYIGGWLGSGVIHVIFDPWACIRSTILIEENTMPIIIRGSVDPYNIEVQDNAYLYMSGEATGIHVRNSHVVIAGLNLQKEGWYGDRNTWGNYQGYGVYANHGANVLITNCDIVGWWYGCRSSASSYVSIQNCVGHVGCLGVAMDGGIISYDRAVPISKDGFWRNTGGFLWNSGYTWDANSKFAYKPDAPPEPPPEPPPPPPPPPEVWTWMENTFWASSLWTTVEGSGIATSAKTGKWGQGKYGKYKPHRGYASFSGIDTWCHGGRNFTMELTMTRENSQHGIAGSVPVPKIKTTNGSFWNSGRSFARGATHTITLPSDVASAFASGGWNRLEMWAGTSTNDYSFYHDVKIRVVCEKRTQ